MNPRRHYLWVAPALALLAAAGCNGGGSSTASSSTDPSFVTITPSASDGVRPDSVVRVRAKGGTVRSVKVVGAAGGALIGAFSADHASWTSRTPLTTNTSYDVIVNAVSAQHDDVLVNSLFTTLKPAHRLAAAVAPLTGETVGVGMPIAVYFSAPVKERAAVERRFHVTTSKGTAGAWHWYSDTEMHYRPPTFWPSGDQVSLSYDLRGVSAGPSTWGDQHRTIDFTIGGSHISKVDAPGHTMRVYDDGKLVQTYPVSTGRDKDPTTSGVHVVLNKNPLQVMDSATVGIPRNSPDGYFEKVPWSVRISNSGEFVHDAPWSVHSQGHVNVSHGCVNLSPTASKWFFDFSRRGDIVEVTGTPRRLQQGNGYADWNLSWSDWIAGDALKA
jgi:lipoprotein-anchoring transpeptidase ErfK/SrfK